MRIKLISCEIFYREMCVAVAGSINQVDIAFLPKGLHDIGREKMLARVQEAVDAVDPARYEAILLGYALCNNGVEGLTARSIPIVIPRAHDCVTLFLGNKERHLEVEVRQGAGRHVALLEARRRRLAGGGFPGCPSGLAGGGQARRRHHRRRTAGVTDAHSAGKNCPPLHDGSSHKTGSF